ncbi:MAG TPA: Lrp/AsnC family transcriptional regulator [Candidatus Saccharimonadales bacterium]|nr:Lrp/AsnC family transcriptional regulator [Candidatus Saccharimonadales bacterium]
MDDLDEELISNVDSGTIKYTALAKKTNTPLSTIHFRMKRLEREKVIRYYKGEVDWKTAGFAITAFVLIGMDKTALKVAKKTQEMILKELLEIMYVREGYITTGEADIFVKIIARDTAHLKDILLDYIDSKEGIVKTNTMIVLG